VIVGDTLGVGCDGLQLMVIMEKWYCRGWW
jgi:hypothetical protein